MHSHSTRQTVFARRGRLLTVYHVCCCRYISNIHRIGSIACGLQAGAKLEGLNLRGIARLQQGRDLRSQISSTGNAH